MSKDFKKGDKVTYFASWNDKGVACYTHAIVHSCGLKQMVLICEKTGNVMGRHFSPKKGERNGFGTFNRVSDTATILHAFKAAQSHKDNAVKYLNELIESHDNQAYKNWIKKRLVDLEADIVNVIKFEDY